MMMNTQRKKRRAEVQTRVADEGELVDVPVRRST